MLVRRAVFFMVNMIFIAHAILMLIGRLTNNSEYFGTSYPVTSDQRSLWVCCILIIVPYWVWYHIVKTILVRTAGGQKVEISLILIPLLMSTLIVYFFGHGVINNSLSLIKTLFLLIPIPLFYLWKNRIAYVMSSLKSHKFLMIPFIICVLLYILLILPYFTSFLFITELFILLFSCVIISLFIIILFFSQIEIISKIRLLSLLLVSLPMFYFSGQSISILKCSDTGCPSYQIGDFFDFINMRNITVINLDAGSNFPKTRNDFYKSFSINNDNNYVFRNEKLDDSVPFGSYKNSFFYRDYYLSKNCRFRILRGLGIAFNLPDNKKYLLKN